MAADVGSETRFHGLGVSPGLAVGNVCLFKQNQHVNLPFQRLPGKGVERERARLDRAGAAVLSRLEGLEQTVAERIGRAEAEIFIAQKMIVQDPEFQRRTREALEKGCNAETAVLRTLEFYEAELLELDDAYIKERASDIGEIKRRFLDVLTNTSPSFHCTDGAHCQRGKNRIVVTEELTPSLTLEMETDLVLGFVTEHGGQTSHGAILARALGIPAVCGIPGIHSLVGCGSEVFLDGDSGEVVVWPSDQTAARADVGRRGPSRERAVEPVAALQVMANISVASEAIEARAMKAEGIGLYRTEFEHFAAGELLNEQAQSERYAAVVEAMAGRPVYFRLLDIGGDKPSDLIPVPKEENPSLGCRGARLLLDRPELLRTQARALVRASAKGPVHAMYPMIVSLEQFRKLREIFDEAATGLPAGPVRHGVMFEVPSACLQAREILEVADFASVGSNDLIQYLFAVDRNNERVAHDFNPDHEVFWGLLASLARAADDAGKPLSLCGELASDPRYIPKLLSVGIRSVSVNPRHIPGVRRAAAGLGSASPAAST